LTGFTGSSSRSCKSWSSCLKTHPLWERTARQPHRLADEGDVPAGRLLDGRRVARLQGGQDLLVLGEGGVLAPGHQDRAELVADQRVLKRPEEAGHDLIVGGVEDDLVEPVIEDGVAPDV